MPVTSGEDEDSSDEPFIQINWDALGDALGDALRNLWEQIQNVEIDLNPNDNRYQHLSQLILLHWDVPRNRS